MLLLMIKNDISKCSMDEVVKIDQITWVKRHMLVILDGIIEK